LEDFNDSIVYLYIGHGWTPSRKPEIMRGGVNLSALVALTRLGVHVSMNLFDFSNVVESMAMRVRHDRTIRNITKEE
jgi:hypothetical protein